MPYEGSGRDDRDAAERVERQQVRIAGYDEVGIPAGGKFEKPVVGRIATGRNSLSRCNQQSHSQQLLQPS